MKKLIVFVYIFTFRNVISMQLVLSKNIIDVKNYKI